MDTLVSKALMIRLSLHPFTGTSAFNKIRVGADGEMGKRLDEQQPIRLAVVPLGGINICGRMRKIPMITGFSSLVRYFHTQAGWKQYGSAPPKKCGSATKI
jgi:hypothetical protein